MSQLTQRGQKHKIQVVLFPCWVWERLRTVIWGVTAVHAAWTQDFSWTSRTALVMTFLVVTSQEKKCLKWRRIKQPTANPLKKLLSTVDDKSKSSTPVSTTKYKSAQTQRPIEHSKQSTKFIICNVIRKYNIWNKSCPLQRFQSNTLATSYYASSKVSYWPEANMLVTIQ